MSSLIIVDMPIKTEPVQQMLPLTPASSTLFGSLRGKGHDLFSSRQVPSMK